MDETTYAPGTGSMGAEHPIAWCQDYDGGRSWYTGMGHTEANFVEPSFLKHILGGIQTAAGVVPSDCKATLQPSFAKVALDENTTNPMELAIADDGRVFYIDRAGAVKIILTNGSVVTAGTVPVYTGQEFGLLGIALDPDFATNGHVFLYYAPQGTASIDRISRFTVTGNTMDLNSAVTILDVPVQRNECCHAGGSMEFDQDGNLYLATGDNTNPFDSGGFTPIDERAGRSAWDAQRTSGNTNDLNGKVLKIKPAAAGGYTIPAGNLFDEAADTTGKTRPEIYAMGFRNPFRIGLDEQNNHILVADYGPDSSSTSATRGPNGRVEWNVLDQPGNYGWPYCVGANTPYNDYNFASSTAGATFNCAAPVNDSPNNTGLTNLPPAKAAVIWQSNNAATTGTPEIGASGAPMTSGTYDYDPDPGLGPQVARLLRLQGDLGRLEQQPALHRPDERRRHQLHRHQPLPAQPGHASPARAAVRPGRCALHDRVGQRLRRQQRRLRHLPDRLRRGRALSDRPGHHQPHLRSGPADRELRRQHVLRR